MTDSRTQTINNIISSLSTWKTTGIEPSSHGQEDKNIQLNILARILFVWQKDVCIALCLWDKKMLVASNRNSPSELIKKDLEKWKKFIQSESSRSELRLYLLRDALRRSYNAMEKGNFLSVLMDRSLTETDRENLEEFSSLTDAKSRTASEEEIVSLLRKLFDLSRLLERRGNISLANKIWDFISPIEDSNKMMELICKGKLDSLLLNAVKNLDDLVVPVNSEENIHAEMKIVDYVFDSLKQTTEENSCKYFYIGIGKLCCLPCQKVVDVVNWSNRFRIGVPGTHGKTYNWKLLKSFRNNNGYDHEYNRFKEELERIKDGQYAQFVRESTCFVPKVLTSFVLEEISVVAQQQQNP